MYAQSHVDQKTNIKINRLINEYGIGAFGTWHDVLISAKLQTPGGRFIDRASLEAALWPQSAPYIDALIECELLLVDKHGVLRVSKWSWWQASQKKRLHQAELSESDRKKKQKAWAAEKRQRRTCYFCNGYIKDGTPKERLEPGKYVHEGPCPREKVRTGPSGMNGTQRSTEGPVMSGMNRPKGDSADTLSLSPQTGPSSTAKASDSLPDDASGKWNPQPCRVCGRVEDVKPRYVNGTEVWEHEWCDEDDLPF